MPLHPVPIIIGTTLAVIGGGIAFKKFVYDPHVAPYIEAFIAAHTPTQRTRTKSGPIPVPLHPTTARSSARRDRTAELRQRRFSNDLEEDAQPLLDFDTEEGGHRRRRRHVEHGSIESFKVERTSPENRPHGSSSSPYQTPVPRSAGMSNAQKFEEYSRPMTPQDSEIRQVFFDLPPGPRPLTDPTATSIPSISSSPYPLDPNNNVRSPARSPHHGVVSLGLPGQSLMALNSLPLPAQSVQPESTTFSFLSLSQASSPEAPNAMLASMTFSDAADQWADVPRALAAHTDVPGFMSPRSTRADEYDVMSLPETSSMSGYEDAEAYSPTSVMSPMRPGQLLPQGPPQPPGYGKETDAMDVKATERESKEEGEASPYRDAADEQPTMQRPGRRAQSVVSLSESEGWGGESDWEGKREAGRR